MNKIKIDILMTVHNGERFLEQAIKSLKSQKYQNWQLIIINNFSTDKTSEILNKIKSNPKKIKVFNTHKLYSRPEVLNLGMKLCKNDYIGILDADDLVSANWLKDVKDIIIKNKNFGAIVGKYIFINEKNKIFKQKKLFDIKQGLINHMFSYTLPCAHSGSIFNKKIIDKFKKPYDESLKTGHDWRLFLKISSKNNILFVKKQWIYWRRYKQSVTAQNQVTSKIDIIKNLLYAKKKVLSFSNKLKNNFMILIQFYHLIRIFAFNKKLFQLTITLFIILVLPLLLTFNSSSLIMYYLNKIK